jgi:RHS repeat-associated protein
MNGHQPRTTASYGYDSTYSSFQSAGLSIFGYDVSPNRFAALNLVGSAGKAAKSRQFTGKERDQESGLDYFGARYYGSALGRFTSPDPLRASGNPKNPQSWNRYSYVFNNPLALIDPKGQCTAPAVGKGQVGVCVDLYVAAPTINGLGKGDNRGPAPNESSATYRTEVQLAIDPKNGTVKVVKNDAGESKASIVRIPGSPAELDISHKGSSITNVSNVSTDKDGDTHFHMSNVGLNGLSSLPGAPKDTIKTDLNFVATPDGKVGLDPGGMRTAYPSLEIYRYDSGGNPTTILQVSEKNPGDLCCENQKVPAVPPQ